MDSEPTTTATPNRHRARWGWLAALLVLPVAAVVALSLGAAPNVSGLLALVGLALTVMRLVAMRRTGVADRVLVGVGGTVVALILTGIVIDALGLRLRPASWTLAVVVLTALGLGVTALLPARERPNDSASTAGALSTALRALPWVAVAAVVTVVAVHMSAVSLSRADQPPLQMSLGTVSGSQVRVQVSSTDAVGPLEVRTSAGGDDVSYPLFDLGHDGSKTVTLTVPATGRFVITLNYPDQTEPLRTLILDR